MIDPAFKEAALTSPMGSIDADIRWMDNDGKIIFPTLEQKVSEYLFGLPKKARMRAFDTVRVPAKQSGKTIFKRVQRAYPVSRPRITSDNPPAAKRVCIFAPSFRTNEEPSFFENRVKNAGFWDNLSAQVHTRNALYSDNVLPWTETALPLRQKHWRDSTVDTPTSPAVNVAMILNLEKMALASTRFLCIADMTDPVVSDVRQERRKVRLSALTSLPTIEEESEPDTPGPVRSTARSQKRRQRCWFPTRYRTSPIRRSAKPARVSPSPERSPAKRSDKTPVSSTPTRVLFSKTEVHISPSKAASPAPTDTPLRVFSSNESEPTTPVNDGAQSQCHESSHLQRSRRHSGARRSIASQSRISAIDGEDTALDQDSTSETPTAQKTTATAVLEDSDVEEAAAGARPEDATIQNPPVNPELEKSVIDLNDSVVQTTIVYPQLEESTIKKTTVDAGSEDSAFEKSIFYTGLEEPVIDKTTMDARLEDSVLEQTRGQTLRKVCVYFGPMSERRLSDASRATSIPEYSVDAREHLDIFNQPITAVKTLAEVASEVRTAISDSRVIVEKMEGKFIVRFKLPSTYADVFNSRYPTTTSTVVHGGSDPLHDEADIGDDTHMSTNTDELIAGLPATPTYIVLGGSPMTHHEGRDLSSSVNFASTPAVSPSPTPAAFSSTPVVSPSATPTAKRVEDQAPISPPAPTVTSSAPAVPASPTPGPERVEDQVHTSTLSTPAPEKVEEQESISPSSAPAVSSTAPTSTREEDQFPASAPAPAGPASSTPAPEKVEDRVSTSLPLAPTSEKVEDHVSTSPSSGPTPEKMGDRVSTSPPLASTPDKVEDNVSTSPPLAPAPKTVEDPVSTPKHSTTPDTFDSLLNSPFAPSCAGTPKRLTPASPSRALEHDVPSEPREMSGEAATSRSPNLAETQEAATRAYLGKFLSEHKATKAARTVTQELDMLSQATSTGSPKPRTPLGHIDVNAASPTKAGTKRRADSEEEVDVGKPPVKRGRKGSALNPRGVDQAPLRRSSRVKAKTQENLVEANSKIPVRVGSGVFGGPAAGGETKEADLASVTRANTRRNKGKAIPPAEVLARQRQDPASRRMQELKEVHDARAARAGKVAKKGVQWGQNEEVIYHAEEEDDDDIEAEKNAPAPKKKAGRPKKSATKNTGSQKKTTDPKTKVTKPTAAKKTTDPKTKATKPTAAKKTTDPKTKVTKPTAAKKTVKAKPATPIKRQTRASTRRDQEKVAGI